MELETARHLMVAQQVRAAEVLDPRALEVMAVVPREHFVPERFRALAFAETRIPLGHGETMMDPRLEGRVLQALAVQPTDRVLEIGTGSGYLTACLARMGTSVRSYDIQPEFTERARARLASLGVRNAQCETGDMARLPDDLGRFEAIAVTGSLPLADASFERHLAPGGRLFMVVGTGPAMEARLVTRVGDEAFAREVLFETELAPLRNARGPSRFTL